MFGRMFDNNNYRTRSALEIEQRIRQREGLRWWLEAEYGTRKDVTRKPLNKRLATLLNNLFSLSI